MSEEKKAVELKDEELEKVNGGGCDDIVEWKTYPQGSVFIPTQKEDYIIVLTEVMFTGWFGANPEVPYIRYIKYPGDKRWTSQGYQTMPMSVFLETYQYSAELTDELSGKLEY